MRELTRAEVVAMWLWGHEYSLRGMGAIEWYKSLSESRRRNVKDFIAQYEAARERDIPSPSPEPHAP